MGQTSTALFIKAVLRPIFKGLYHVISFIRNHRLISLIVLVLLLASIAITSYETTGKVPLLSPSSDQSGIQQARSDAVTNVMQQWLTALQKGNVNELKVLDSNMQSPPDPNLLVSQFSQNSTRTWSGEKLIGGNQESDATIDTFVEVDLTTTESGTTVHSFMIWHFVIGLTQQNSATLLSVDFVGNRQSLNG
jgi:hypothetical protein